ncbi:putative enoyl-CoA hydratase echA8 [Paraconexibacter sp. AEG42_29]|uniref:Enoyl-CoA hydratase echA8 n=1 Tax=Paraconexibacter sp. AEG42_29 TaxID=2997339 RepID=A0AAU7B2C1_9ACTN
MEPVVLTRADAGVGTLTLNRPDAMNAITVELATRLEQGLAELAGRDDVHVIVVRGAGGNFCVGGDFKALQELRAQGPDAMAGLFEAFGRATAVIATLDVPVIAAVEGFAMAGGFELMQASDIVVVADEAKIADNHSNFGMVPGGGGSQRLPRLVGRQRALTHILTGDRLRGPDAVAWGLAYRSVPAAELDAVVVDLAAKLAAKDPRSLAGIKRLVLDGLQGTLDDGLALERRAVVDHIAGEAGGAGIASFTTSRGA